MHGKSVTKWRTTLGNRRKYFIFMWRIFQRTLTLSCNERPFCRQRHSYSAVPCLKWERTEFNGVDVNLNQLGESVSLEQFDRTLRESILQWRRESKKSIWMKVPISQSYLIPVAFTHGFNYHHAVGNYAMLLKWLPQQVACNVPPYASHQIGVAGMVLNKEKNEVLVVQDKHMVKFGKVRKAVWKFPGGLSDEGESIEETAIREVYEETGVKSEFKSVIMFRQQHQMKNAFGKSDIYLICRMAPLSYGISRCEDEIAKCEWMNLSTLLTHTDTGPMTRLAARLATRGLKNGFENVDILSNRMTSWIDPKKTVCLFHRYLPS